MANYFIIGGDGKEYGPITETDVQQWLAEGRLAASSLAKAESDAEFRPLEKFPEFAENFTPARLSMAATPPPIEPLKAPTTLAPEAATRQVLPDDYELDLIACLTRGYELLKDNFSTLFVGALIYWLIQFGASALGNIPFLGLIFTLANFVCAGPLMAGLFYLFIRVNRGEPGEISDVFTGFRRGFGQLFLATLVQTLIMGVCFLPFFILFGLKLFSMIGQFRNLQAGGAPDPAAVQALFSLLLTSVPILLVCILPALYLSVSWKFALPLIIDQQMDFITALKTSWRMVNKHWFLVFGLLALIGILNTVGVMLCCVGLLFTFPIGIAALVIAYETIFCAAKK